VTKALVKSSKTKLVLLHWIIQCSTICGIISVVIKGLNPLIIITALICVVAGLPLFIITERKVKQDPAIVSFPLFFSQCGLVICGLLSLSFLSIIIIFFISMGPVGFGPGD